MKKWLLVGLLVGSPAWADCNKGEHLRLDQMERLLEQRYQERLEWGGLANQGRKMVQRWSAPDGSTWTLILISPQSNGPTMACMMASGGANGPMARSAGEGI